MSVRKCDVCQTEYQAEPRYLNRGQGKTCSKICGHKLWRLNNPKVEHLPSTTCGWCHAPIYRKPSDLVKRTQFFCNKLHQNAAFVDGLVRTGPTKVRPLQEPRLLSADMTTMWLAGDNDVTLFLSQTTHKPTGTKGFVKRYLVETRGDQCELCGFRGANPHTNNSVIQMDHTDGNCFNNAPENLRLLCPNCHSMTPNYGSLNKGSGRAHRRR